jgi:hypothetical protein
MIGLLQHFFLFSNSNSSPLWGRKNSWFFCLLVLSCFLSCLLKKEDELSTLDLWRWQIFVLRVNWNEGCLLPKQRFLVQNDLESKYSGDAVHADHSMDSVLRRWGALPSLIPIYSDLGRWSVINTTMCDLYLGFDVWLTSTFFIH